MTLHRFALILLSFTAFTATGATPPAGATDGAVRYRVASSDLHILVYRGGPMARMGHNHVVSSKDVSGELLLHPELSRSMLKLEMPVASLIVDDPTARAPHGEDFAGAIPADAREGTKKNLLREEVLDGTRFPAITLQSVALRGTRAQPQLTMRITIKNASRDVAVVAAVQEQGERLTAKGEFAIKQSDFGIKPFRVALGALQVQDELKVKFSIVCVQEQ